MKQLAVILLAAWCWAAGAAEVIPPVPAQWFNDYAHVVSPATATRLNKTLEDFEHATSSQVVVAVFPTMPSASSIEDYTVRVAQAWKVGQKNKNNGVVLFVFVQDRKMFIQVGYGLEGALPDATCKRIIEDELKPRFRNNDFDGGLSAGVAAILAATKGEYKGSNLDSAPPLKSILILAAVMGGALVLGIIFIAVISRKVRKAGGNWHGITVSRGGWSSGGSSWSSGGGGFSSGGGSFGGGGAGGSW